MNKQAYEHTVGLVLSKNADWDAFTGATKDWWNGLGEDTQRNIIAGGATAILGGILGGATGGVGGSLLGTIGGGLLGYHGMKHGKPQWDNWMNYYNNYNAAKAQGKGAENAYAQQAVAQEEAQQAGYDVMDPNNQYFKQDSN